MSQEIIQNLTWKVAHLENYLAEFEGKYQQLGSNVDVFFLLIVSMVIYFMQCGFALLECGSVRSKNATNILLKNVLDAYVACIAYYLIGYALSFGGGNAFCGTTYWAGVGMDPSKFAHWFFQFVFAATAATIVSGAMAERCEFVAYLVYSFAITGFIYPIVVHWAWAEQGWLNSGPVVDGGNGTVFQLAFQDFAGSGVVHLVGGTAAFVGAAIIGPRIGRFDDYGRPNNMPGHSVPLAGLGGFILFFGFFAFNGGSVGAITGEGNDVKVALACINTILAATFGAITCLIFKRIDAAIYHHDTKWSLLITINGALAGMVAVCAGCDGYQPYVTIVVGTVGGFSYIFWSWLTLKLKVDDPIDAVAVHGGAGLWGVIAAPLLKRDTGVVYVWTRKAGLELAWNLAGAGAIIAWTGTLAAVIFGVLRVVKLLRVDPEIETKGLDIPKHGEPAYPVIAYGHGWGEKGDTLSAMASLASPLTFSGIGSKKSSSIIKRIGDEAKKEKPENAELDARQHILEARKEKPEKDSAFSSVASLQQSSTDNSCL